MCQMHQKEEFKFCLDTRNNKALPLDPTSFERLCSITRQFPLQAEFVLRVT
jgi:hypothetical protein